MYEIDINNTYPDEVEQTNKINTNNAKVIFSPRFIPIYPCVLDDLTLTEALLYGFIHFYVTKPGVEFYFSNEQLAEIIKCSSDKVSRSMSRLVKLGYIKVKREIKWGGGQIRFVTWVKDTNTTCIKDTSISCQKVQTNNNKINNNKKNIYMGDHKFVKITEKEYAKLTETYPRKHVDSIIEDIDNYIGGNGKRYKSHYHVALSRLKKQGVPKNPKYI